VVLDFNELGTAHFTREKAKAFHQWFLKANIVQRCSNDGQTVGVALLRHQTLQTRCSRIGSIFHISEGTITNLLSEAG
jgi:hypothetical protein